MPSFLEGAQDYCQWLTRTSGSNFALGLRLLPGHKRQAMEAVYAFCRAVDDVVDRQRPNAQEELNLWRKELAACANGFPAHPIAVALKPVLKQYAIPMEHFEALIRGVEMDLTRRRYQSFEELKVYCEHVASVVGLISIRIFGCEHPASERYARNLGVALQLTNILRDLKTDAQQGRIYLPLKELQQFGYSEQDLLSGRYTDSFTRLMNFQCERAHEFFAIASAALRESREAKKLFPARIMGGVYALLLKRIEKFRYDVFSHRISVPRHEQLWVATKCLVLSGAAG